MAPSQTTFVNSQRGHLKAVTAKQIAGTMIVARFFSALQLPPNTNSKKKLSDILGGGLVKWDLGLELMRYASFKRDGLIVQKSDVMNADTVGDLGDLVFQWYLSDGWTVT